MVAALGLLELGIRILDNVSRISQDITLLVFSVVSGTLNPNPCRVLHVGDSVG